MNRILKTIDLKGKAYATVPTRIKEFREVCPNGLISTDYKFIENDTKVAFRTRILKDKSDETSGEGTGTSFGPLKDAKGNEIPKAFEKLETISIGRALAILGFMASGEVASFEEMEDFMNDKETKRQFKIQEIKEEVDGIDNIDKLREFFKENRGYGIEVENYIMDKVKQLKNG